MAPSAPYFDVHFLPSPIGVSAGEAIAARHDGEVDGQGMPNSTVRPCTMMPSALRSRMPVQALAVCAAAKVIIAAAAMTAEKHRMAIHELGSLARQHGAGRRRKPYRKLALVR